RTTYVYRHDLIGLHQRDLTCRINPKVDKIPEKFRPRKFVISSRVGEAKGCIRCCVARNPSNGYRYLAVLLPHGILLLQWYEPLQRFMRIQLITCKIPIPFPLFEMFVSPELEYPVVCCGVRLG
ncbi:unnamed protein product, partial [Soboliphyme baturini]|uniref:CNH domain-containing protein n=1 Tax=Soboliphyme baturini TaxID=241478 RepID=A0A183JAH2_9BILA